jgi:hypothetical protein
MIWELAAHYEPTQDRHDHCTLRRVTTSVAKQFLNMSFGRALSFTVIASAVGLIIAACDDDPKGSNGVNDVRAACEIRLKWVRANNDCSLCESAATTPRCDCTTLASYSAACTDQQDARRFHCSEAIEKCVATCVREDCDCIVGCYKNDPFCRDTSAARDGCVAEVCDPFCK